MHNFLPVGPFRLSSSAIEELDRAYTPRRQQTGQLARSFLI